MLSTFGIGKEMFLIIYLFIHFQVALFSPSRSAHYLNVTLSNLVKVHVLLVFTISQPITRGLVLLIIIIINE